MKTGRGIIALVGALAFAGMVQPPVIAAPPIAEVRTNLNGLWQGEFKLPMAKLHFVLHLTQSPDGALSGNFDVIEQGLKGFPLDSVTLEQSTLTFTCNKLHASFKGTLSSDGKGIKGQWTQGGQNIELVLEQTGTPIVFKRPQEPAPPFPYDVEEVGYINPQGNVKLAGTLTRPRVKGPVPAVIMITGSGAQDRDEAIMGHRPFLIWADTLTRRGIAVLRVDDRGIGGSGGNPEISTTQDFAGDVLAGINYLKGRNDIDGKRIGLIGHSEGGIIAPMVAAKSTDVHFIVMLAGTGIPGNEIIQSQSAVILRKLGMPESEVAKKGAINRQIYDIAMNESDLAVAERKIKAILSAEKLPEDQLQSTAKSVLSPWMRFFLRFDPKVALAKTHCPVLAINGEKDVQVIPKENLPVIEKILKDNGNRDVTTKAIPNANHLFQTCNTGMVDEYSQIEETVAPSVLQLVSDWIVQHSK